jgi:hypothetical protein
MKLPYLQVPLSISLIVPTVIAIDTTAEADAPARGPGTRNCGRRRSTRPTRAHALLSPCLPALHPQLHVLWQRDANALDGLGEDAIKRAVHDCDTRDRCLVHKGGPS